MNGADTTDAVKVAIERIKARFHPHYGIDGASDSKQLASDCQTLIAALDQAGALVAAPVVDHGITTSTVVDRAKGFYDTQAPLATLQRLGQEFDAGEALRQDRNEAIMALTAKFGPILKAAFPNEHSRTRFDVANALAEVAVTTPSQPDPKSRGQAFDGEGEAVNPDTARLDALRDECWDLRCFSVPTGGDDADVAWKVVGHWMAEPQERTIAEGWSHDPRVAIDAALSSAKRGEG